MSHIFFSESLLGVLLFSFLLGGFSGSAQTLFIASAEELGILNIEEGVYNSLTVSPIRARNLIHDSSRGEIISLEGDNRTITRFDEDGGFVGRVIAESPISVLAVSTNGVLYASSFNRVFQLDRRTGELLPFFTVPSVSAIQSLIITNDELLLVNSLGEFIRISLLTQEVLETKAGDFMTVGFGATQDAAYVVEEVGNNVDSGSVYLVDLSSVPAGFEFVGTFDDVFAASSSGDSDMIYLAQGNVRQDGASDIFAYTRSTFTLERLPIRTDFQYGIYAYGATSSKGILATVYDPDLEQVVELQFYNAANGTLSPVRANSKSYTSARKLYRLDGNNLLAYQPDFSTIESGSSRIYDAGNFSSEFNRIRQSGFQTLYEDRSEDRLLIRDGTAIRSIDYDLRRTTTLGAFALFPGETIWAEQARVFLASQVSGQEVSIVEPSGNVTSTFRLDFSRFGYNFYAASDNDILYFSGADQSVGEDLKSRSFRNLQAAEEVVFDVSEDEAIIDVEIGRDTNEILLVLESNSDNRVFSIIKNESSGVYSSTLVAVLPSYLNINDTRLFDDLFISSTGEVVGKTGLLFDAWWDGEALQVRASENELGTIKVFDLSGKLIAQDHAQQFQHSLTLPASTGSLVVVSIEVDGAIGSKLVHVSN